MPRYRIDLEYDGTPFVGWQKQDNGLSVQEALTIAIARLAGEDVQVLGAGRTDTGVHALGQVAHFDLVRDWNPHKLLTGLNYYLRPNPISVLTSQIVADNFHSRFDAIGRSYRYRIINRRAELVHDRDKAWLIHVPLDADAMHEAAQVLIGRHDFTTFRATRCQSASPVKTLDRLTVRRRGEEIIFEVAARSFLHNQVRSMVGSLRYVGDGKWTVADLVHALDACERAACGPVAPACGLYLESVTYRESDSSQS